MPIGTEYGSAVLVEGGNVLADPAAATGPSAAAPFGHTDSSLVSKAAGGRLLGAEIDSTGGATLASIPAAFSADGGIDFDDRAENDIGTDCDNAAGCDVGIVTHHRMSPPVSVAMVPSNMRCMAAFLRKSLTLTCISPRADVEWGFISIIVLVPIEITDKPRPTA